MNRKRTLALLLGSTALMIAPGVLAQDDEEEGFLLEEATVEEPAVVYTSEIEAGIGWVSQDSFKFGEFSGLQKQGVYVIGNFRIQMRDAYDQGDGEYWILTGTNVGLESRALRFEYGKQGKFGIHADLDQIPKYLLDDARTPYIANNNNTLLTLPAGWVANDRDPDGLVALHTSLRDVNIDHQRTKFGGGFSWIPRKNWLVTSEFHRELKEGTRTIAAIFGSSGGDPGGAVVPEPIDYETDDLDVAIAYSDKKTQWVLNYNLSVFRDNDTGLTFQNAFDSSRWEDVANFPDGYGRLATPPDNKAHRVTLSGAYRFDEKTRGTVNLSYGKMTQDDPFLPFTVNPDLMVGTPLPRSSLKGEIQNTRADVGLSSRVTPELTLRARYRYENRDNNTPRDIFVVVPGDSQNQETVSDDRARVNTPYGRKQQLIEATADYRLSSMAKLTVGYNYEQFQRNFSEVAKTKEHRIEAKLRATPSSDLSGWVGVQYGNRDGSSYVDNAVFLASHSPEFLAETDEEFENHPLVRKFFIADRDRLKFSGAVNWVMTETSVVSVMGRYTNDQYDNSTLGLTDSTSASVTVDASYNPEEVVTYHAYYTYELYDHKQTGFSHRPGTDLTDFAGQNWSADIKDKVSTVGAGFDWAAIKDQLDVVFDYSYSKANTGFGLSGGTNIEFLPLPDLKTRLHAMELKADYHYTDNLFLRFRWLFQDFSVSDFALDNVDVDTMRLIIGLGNQAPNYSVHVVGVSTIYRF